MKERSASARRAHWKQCHEPALLPFLHFELDGVEGSLEQMDGAVVGVDHQLPIGPLRIFVSADEEFEGEQTVIRLPFYSDGRRLH